MRLEQNTAARLESEDPMISKLIRQRGNQAQRVFLRPFSLAIWMCAFVLGVACATPMLSIFGASVTYIPMVEGAAADSAE
jgi:hypothetical protein